VDIAVFMNVFTLCVCVCESFVTWFARNILTEICEACLASKICQQLCRVVSLGGVVKFCLSVFMVKFCKYVKWV